MIPEFPLFKKIELSDKEDIEKITTQYPPYSDFNFISMWSWDINENMRISQLHGNLVVKFTDYLTGEPFYSFLGNNKSEETTHALLELCKKEGIKPCLLLMPHHSIDTLRSENFKISEDINNFDYIYDLTEISTYKGGKFLDKRNKVNFFLKNFPQTTIEVLNLQDFLTQQKIIELNTYWLNNKIKKDFNFKIENELLATQRFLQGNFSNVVAMGLYIEGTMIGYSIMSLLPNCYAASHFCKANTNYKGVYEYMIRECAKILISYNCNYFNYEQDLGLEGLRKSKMSFMLNFLKKFVAEKVV